jgi:hypothetical protein
MLEILASALYNIIDFFMMLFGIGHWLEHRMGEGSVVGQSQLDREGVAWRRKVLRIWWVIGLLLVALTGGGVYIWHYFAR